MPPLIATWTAVIMVIIVPFAVVEFTPTPPGRVWMAVLAITTISGLRYAWIVGEGFRRLVEMSFWVFTYVFMGLAPLAQLRLREIPPTTPRVDPSSTRQRSRSSFWGSSASWWDWCSPVRSGVESETRDGETPQVCVWIPFGF
ncbi:hypothetical protein GCM10020255_098110 [Rhodococcus baikonurensis]